MNLQISWPPGYRVMVTGHRNIFDAQALLVQNSLRVVLSSLQKKHPEGLVAISGMAVGADMEFNDAALSLNIPLVAALPVENHGSNWPVLSQQRHALQLSKACLTYNVWEDPAYFAGSYSARMHARNRWMLDQVQEGTVIGIWDGRRTGGTFHAIDLALKRGNKVLVLDPNTGGLRVEKP